MADVKDEASFPTLFQEETVLLGLEASDKKEVLAKLVDVLVEGGAIEASKRDAVYNALVAREGLGSTGIGGGIAIPHVKLDEVSRTVTAIGVSKKRIDFRAVDGEPCDLFLLLVSPKSEADNHLRVLRWLSKLVRNPDFCRFMRGARDRGEAVSLMQELGG